MKNVKKSIVAIFVTFIIASAAVYILINSPMGNLDIGNFVIGVVSLIISAVALIISLFTYFSIDSVNDISTLDGNVLENETYAISPVTQFREYCDIKESQVALEKIYFEQNCMLKKQSGTNLKFTDCIQKIIDDYFIVGWYNYHNEHYQKVMQENLGLIDKRYKRMKNISNGTQYIVDENIKLLQYLYKVGRPVDIYEIRGDLFKNQYTKYLYYDSVGRDYYFKALRIIEKYIHGSNPFLISQMKELEKAEIFEEDRKKLSICFENALTAFGCAMGSELYNKPYSMFIYSSMERIYIMQNIIFQMSNNIKESFQKSIHSWDEFIFDLNIDLQNVNGRYMVTGVLLNYFRVKLVYYNYLVVKGETSLDFKEEIKNLKNTIEKGKLCEDYDLINISNFINEWMDEYH